MLRVVFWGKYGLIASAWDSAQETNIRELLKSSHLGKNYYITRDFYWPHRIVRIVACRRLWWSKYVARMGRQAFHSEFLYGNVLENICLMTEKEIR
jgi:hypothetical protein